MIFLWNLCKNISHDDMFKVVSLSRNDQLDKQRRVWKQQKILAQNSYGIIYKSCEFMLYNLPLNGD